MSGQTYVIFDAGRVLGVTAVEESYGKPFADLLADRNAERMEGHVHDVAEALAAHHKAEIEKWWPLIKAANIKLE